MNIVQLLLPKIESFHFLGYWIAFLAATLETTIGVGLFIPGSTIVLFMGALAAKGYFDLGDLIWFAAVGAILGDNINYFIGKKYGSKIFIKGFWFIKPDHFKKGEIFFQKYGSKSVFIGRFIPSIKEVIPLIAGTFGMKRTPFVTWNIFGAIGWSLTWILPGYFFAQSLDFAKIWLTRVGFFLTIMLVIFIILYILKIFLVKKGKQLFAFLFSVWKSIKQAVLENPEVQKLVERHSKFFGFLQNRLNKSSFYGLPLTLFFLALLYVILLFGGIVEDIVNSDIIVAVDIRVANLIAIFRNSELTKFFFLITLLGKWQIILIFTVATILILWLRGKQSYILPLLLCITGSEIFTYTGKFIFHRARPGVAIYPESSFSFPSGHATIAVAFYGFIAYILIKNLNQWKRKINSFFIGLIFILFIGFSRLYLGVHYMSDVWGGYLIGAIWLIISASFSEYLLYKKQEVKTTYSETKKNIATAAIVLSSICLYTIFSFNYKIPVSSSTKVNQITISEPMKIFTTDQLRYTETLLSDTQEPLSFIIVAKNDEQFINLFEKSGWNLADEVSISSTIKLAYASLLKKSYPKAPMTPDFWNANVHDFGFQKSTNLNNVRTRHHARFWKTNYITENGNAVYVGTASFDSGIKWGIVHRINPDIDTEREFLFNDLQKTGMLVNVKKQQSVSPELGSNFSGDLFFTDGKLYLITVK